MSFLIFLLSLLYSLFGVEVEWVNTANLLKFNKDGLLNPSSKKTYRCELKFYPEIPKKLVITGALETQFLSTVEGYMVFLRKFRKLPLTAASCALVWFSTSAFSVTLHYDNKKPYLTDVTVFSTKLSLSVSDRVHDIKMPMNKMKTRLLKSPSNDAIEPLQILMRDDVAQFTNNAEKLAKVGSEEQLAEYFSKQWKSSKPYKPGAQSRNVVISREAYELVDKRALADLFARTHHEVIIQTDELRKNRKLRREFFSQLRPFFSKKQRRKLMSKIRTGHPIRVDTELLSEFAAKMIRKYTVYRGPNCFHAALAFHSPKITSSSRINVKEEVGYHRAMINYDELWRAINSHFYEINPEVSSLKYGDMLVFFDLPEGAEDEVAPTDFRWIRHAATYLFGGYTFSKGSKSANTPYSVRTLVEEWQTWKKYTKKLGIKVFRRSQKSVKKQPPKDLDDWLY